MWLGIPPPPTEHQAADPLRCIAFRLSSCTAHMDPDRNGRNDGCGKEEIRKLGERQQRMALDGFRGLDLALAKTETSIFPVAWSVTGAVAAALTRSVGRITVRCFSCRKI